MTKIIKIFILLQMVMIGNSEIIDEHDYPGTLFTVRGPIKLPRFKGRVHDVRALELRPEIFRMGYFWGELSDYDTVISLRRFIYTVRPTYSDIRILG